MKKARRLTVAIPAELNKFVRLRIEEGSHKTEDEVVRDALLMLREQEDFITSQQRQFRREIAIGLKQARQGLVGPFSAAEIKSEGRKRLRARRKAG